MFLHVIGDILFAEPEQRAVIINHCQYVDLDEDVYKIISVIKELNYEFELKDIYLKLEKEDRPKLISMCMDAYIQKAKDKIIKDMRSNKNTKYIGIFK